MTNSNSRQAALLGVLVVILITLLVTGCGSYEDAAQGDVVKLKQTQFCIKYEGAGPLQSYAMRLDEEGIKYQFKRAYRPFEGDYLSCLSTEDGSNIIIPKRLLEEEVKR
jgi:hypothetical protein